MKSLRIRISHLKNKINENINDDNDIYGYEGINKKGILESLDESYNLLAVLESFNDKFETVFAKREVAGHIDHINYFIDNTLHSEEVNEKLNHLLNSIFQIRFILKEAYLSLTTEAFRNDYELAKAKEQIQESTQVLDNLKEIKTEIDSIHNSSKEFIEELEKKHKTALESEEKITDFENNINEIDEDLKGTHEKINVWKTEISSLKEDITTKQSEINKLKVQVEELIESNNSIEEKSGELSQELTEQIEKNKKHQTQIQETIDDVSRSGMASSFKKRKDELKWTQLVWSALTVLALGGLVYISYTIVEPLIKGEDLDANQLLFKIPVFASAVWLGWFCSKQYGYTSRIREDYAYKYAISMAFEGYKNETREVDNDLLDKLIELTIFNVSKNPANIFNTKNNHGSPYNEMFDTIAKNFSRNKDKTEDEE